MLTFIILIYFSMFFNFFYQPTKNKRGRVVVDTSPKNVGKKIKVAVTRKPRGIKKSWK